MPVTAVLHHAGQQQDDVGQQARLDHPAAAHREHAPGSVDDVRGDASRQRVPVSKLPHPHHG